MQVRVNTLLDMKRRGYKIPCITAYDYPSACIADAAGIPLILVGDSLGNVVLGFESTVHVTMVDMMRHTQAVVRGVTNALIVADMPFMSFQISIEEGIRNAGRLVQEAGAHAVKLEGGRVISPLVHRIVEAGIPVLGHVGLTPQSVNQIGGYRVQGRTLADAQKLIMDAHALEESGAFGVVLESVPGALARIISDRISIPTIGIGAGDGCDGQIQVLHDVLGLGGRQPKHAKSYADLNGVIEMAISAYAREVRDGLFPTEDHTTRLDGEILRDLLDGLAADS